MTALLRRYEGAMKADMRHLWGVVDHPGALAFAACRELYHLWLRQVQALDLVVGRLLHDIRLCLRAALLELVKNEVVEASVMTGQPLSILNICLQMVCMIHYLNII